MGLAMLLWAVIVLNPMVETFSHQFYDALSFIMPEEAWGIVFLVGAISLMWGVLNRNIAATRLGANIGFLLWLLLSILYGIAEGFTITPIATTACIALMHAWLFWQVRVHPESITHDYYEVPIHRKDKK